MNWNETNLANRMEVMDENGSTKICQAKSNYPVIDEIMRDLWCVTGVFTNGKMIICAGYPMFRACHVYGDGEGWKKLADMSTSRLWSASFSIPDGIVVTGGLIHPHKRTHKALKTTETVYLNGTVKQSKSLLWGRFGHCIVEYQG